ncbi:MAG: DNA-directed RNA polymerase subunit beta [Patescibacteria group bacterium]
MSTKNMAKKSTDTLEKHSDTKRVFFKKFDQVMKLPDLTEVQTASYKWFFEEGLRELFDEINPIEDFIGRDLELKFSNFYLDDPKFDEVVARERNVTYEAPLRVLAKLVNKRTGEIKEQEVYFGDFPLMTDRGTFIINGIERVIVSQIIRSAGVFFSALDIRGRRYYGAKVIPNRGAWLELETDANNIIYVKIDRKRKVPVTALLRAFGYGSDKEIMDLFADIDIDKERKFIEPTLAKDISASENEGLIEVYKRIRPGDLATPENAKSLIHSMFFKFERYDFGAVGRHKLNKRFSEDFETSPEHRVFKPQDLINIIKEIIRLNLTQDLPDDIDHLGNRRVRSGGELVQNKFRIGLARMERIVKDRMSTLDINTITPNQLINARPLIGSIKEFFMSSQLSQFMDQTNPLAELEHKRRISAMGPGGLTRERAGFEVRDVHQTHYGRLCPIETPEGPNIGLVNHLASYARINNFGFIETPFRKVVKELPVGDSALVGKFAQVDLQDPKSGKVIVKKDAEISKSDASSLKKAGVEKVLIKPFVTDEVEYLDAFDESKYTTTPATTPIDENGYFVNPTAEVRQNLSPTVTPVEDIDYMDVSPKQILSIATSLIPFVEHDDSSRALMGTNMQRQAVPLVRAQSPQVGTGVERRAALDSGHGIVVKEDGEVTAIHGDKIVVKTSKGEEQEYPLTKFVRSNASTCLNHRVIVDLGDKVKKGDIMADGPSMQNGELALGYNPLIAFMTWEGGNYEDAILVSDRLVHADAYTSIKIEDFEIQVRDTKLGPEVITRDIPNVGEDKLKDLDEEGIVRIGAEVSSGDILVGKITPKGETELSAEEKLLRAIFGEKAKDVRDSSLYLQHGEHGKVIDVKIFSRENGDKLPAGVIKSVQVTIAALRKIQVGDKMAGRHGNKGVISRVVPEQDMPFLADGTPVDIILNPLGIVSRMNLGQLLETHLGFASKILGYKAASPALDGIALEEIIGELKKAGLPEDGKVQLYDGRTGDPFKEKTTVGVMHMLKLAHMVDDKIHQRSIGPYSLVTQQPLGGKAQFGGQRFGEMEVWALEAYGAAHSLQEMLTIKSDDVPGRSKAYESIIKGEEITKINVPESFNVLVREMKGLGLDVELLDEGQTVDEPTDEVQPAPAEDTPPADEKAEEEEK